MYSTNEFKKGLRIMVDGNPYVIVENQFVKPGKGQAFNRVRIKNILNGNVIERTMKSGEKVPKADVQEKEMQYLYAEGEDYHFMDTTSYEQIELKKEQLDDGWQWLQEQMMCYVVFYNGLPISATVPEISWPSTKGGFLTVGTPWSM